MKRTPVQKLALFISTVRHLTGLDQTQGRFEPQSCGIDTRHVCHRPDNSEGFVKVRFLIKGPPSGTRVLLVHGTPGKAENWLPLFEKIPPDMEMVAVDRLGFSKSEPKSAMPSFESQIRSLEPLLNVSGGRKVILVGHSMGGALIALAALLFPHKIHGLLILGGALDPDLEEVFPIQRIGKKLGFLLPRPIRNSNLELIEYERELRRFTDRLGEIRQPVIAIHGTDDRQVPHGNLDFIARSFTGSVHGEMLTLEKESHFLIDTQAELICDKLRFLADLATEKPFVRNR